MTRQDRNHAGLIIYASKYGSTGEYARALSTRLGFPCLSAELAGEKDLAAPRILVIGSPIYGHSVLPSMEGFLAGHRGEIAGKALAAFVVCGDGPWAPGGGEGGRRNLEKLTRLLPDKPLAVAVFGGRLRMEDLDEYDRPGIVAFYGSLRREPRGFDRVNTAAAEDFAGKILLAAREGAVSASR